MSRSVTLPCPAERARTVLVRACPIVVEIENELTQVVDVHGVDADGSPVLLVAAEGRLSDRVAGSEAACVVHAALTSPVPGPDRLLDRVTVRGRLVPVADVRLVLDVVLDAHSDRPADQVLRPDASALLRVAVTDLCLDDGPVDPVAYAGAVCDPLAAGSDEFVEHLLRGHTAEVIRLAHLLEPGVAAGARAVAPIRVDRFGLTYRIDSARGSARARLDFPAALRDPDELPAAMRELLNRAARVTGCPFSGEPRGGCG